MHDKTSDIGVPADGASRTAFDVTHAAHASIVLVPLALWIWLCRDWPTRLGFYSDDWMVLLHPFVGTAEAFHDTLNLVTTRPVSAPYIWLAQVLVDWSPVRSQLLNAAMLLVTAASLGLLSAALIAAVRDLRKGALVGASIAAATFIVFPSTIGTFAWGVGVTTMIPSLPLFCLATSILVHSGNSWSRLGTGLVLALLSHLSYEAFYFQEVVLLLLAATLRGSTIKEVPWRAVAGAVFINAACLAFNRLMPGGIQKSFHWDFIHVFIDGYSHILAILGHAAREYKFLIAGTVIVAGPSGAICLARLVGAARTCLALLLMVGGIIASGLLYASAGYGLAAEGIMARVSIVIATYYAITAGVLAAAAWCTLGWSRLLAVTFYFSATVGLVALELTARARVGEWAETWSYELARLSRLPATITSANMLAGGNQRIYLAIEEPPQLSLAAAAAPWEITGAVAWTTYKTTKSRLLTIDHWKGSRTVPGWFTAAKSWFNRWDGQRFEQGFCTGSTVIYSAPGSELWVWKTSTSVVEKADTPWQYGCQ